MKNGAGDARLSGKGACVSLRRRWPFVLLSVLLLVVLALLWPEEEAPTEAPAVAVSRTELPAPAPQQQPPPVEAQAPVALASPNIAQSMADAGHAPRDAGVEPEGGLMAKSVQPGEAFAARCAEAGAACRAVVVARYLSDGLGGYFLRVERAPGADGFTVREVVRMGGPDSNFETCMRTKLVGVTAAEPALGEDGGWVQCITQPPKPPFDLLDVAKKAAKDCLRTPHDTLEFNGTWVAERTETRLEDVAILTPADADAWERRCVEDRLRLRVMLPPDDRFDPPTRWSTHIKVQAPPPAVAKLRATPDGFAEYARGLPETSLDARIDILRVCTRRFPEASECFLLLGSNLAKKGTAEHDGAALDDAKKAYARFLELAPTDRRAEQVRGILARAQ